MIINQQRVMEILNIKEEELIKLMKGDLSFYKVSDNYRFKKEDILDILLNGINKYGKEYDEFYIKNNINREFIHMEEFSNMFKLDNKSVIGLCDNNELEHVKFNGIYYIKLPKVNDKEKYKDAIFYVNTFDKDGVYCTGVYLVTDGKKYIIVENLVLSTFEEDLNDYLSLYNIFNFANKEGILDFSVVINNKEMVDKLNNRNFNNIKGFKSIEFRNLENDVFSMLSKRNIKFLYSGDSLEHKEKQTISNVLSKTFKDVGLTTYSENKEKTIIPIDEVLLDLDNYNFLDLSLLGDKEIEDNNGRIIEIKFEKEENNFYHFKTSDFTHLCEQNTKFNADSKIKAFLSLTADIAFKNSQRHNQITISYSNLDFDKKELIGSMKNKDNYKKLKRLYEKVIKHSTFVDKDNVLKEFFK